MKKKKPTEPRPFPWIIEDFKPVEIEDHPSGKILTDANGVQILRTNPRRILIGEHYHRVPSQDYIVREKPKVRVKDSRSIR